MKSNASQYTCRSCQSLSNTPERLSTDAYPSVTLDIEVHWMNSNSSSFSADINYDFAATAADIGPYDLSSNNNWTGDVISFWLEFTTGAHSPSSNVRIGWVKLTE